MPKTAFVYHPDYLLHDAGRTHPERPERLRAIVGHLEKTDLLENLLRITPEPADEKWITRIHPADYVRLIEKASERAPAALDPDTRVSKDSFRVAVLAVGGALAAVDAVMEGRAKNAFAAVRPPGHHALAARAMGFCLFNNVAIAARYVQEKYGLKRILIVDWDVHHGNGTQALFYTDPTVLFFSTHQYPFYPGTGAESEGGEGPGKGTTINAPMPAGAGDAEVIRAFREKLLPAAEKFQPEFVLISAGFDGHRRDPLAQLQLTEQGFAELTRIVTDIAGRFAGGRIVSLLEGGYDLEGLSRSVEAHLRALSGQ
ncbi:MAG: histone deacetylase [Nitrospinota bacterium]